jgi:COP9 signalosome complex subunit 5
VIDCFALPVEGTETRVNAAAEGYEYMVDFAETMKARSHVFCIVPAGRVLGINRFKEASAKQC